MKRTLVVALAAAAIGAGAFAPALAQTAPAPIVFFDIAGPDMAKQRAFYSEVFGWKIGANGTLAAPSMAPLDGALRADPPAKVIYLGVPDVTATLDKVVAHGGGIVAPRFEVKGAVVLGLFKDPAGNIMGLVELGPNGQPKVP